MVRKQHGADLAVLVGPARAAKQRAVLFVVAEFLRADEAALPQAEASILGAGLIFREASLAGWLQIERKALGDHFLVQARRLAGHRADAEMPLPEILVRAVVVAMHRPAADQ